jgi:drug/metabolite transporter (DMT)-like permease
VLGISLIGLPDEWILNFSTQARLQLWEACNNFSKWRVPNALAALSMAAGTILIRFVCRYADPVTATGWHMVLGGLPLFAISASMESQQWVNLNYSEWMALGYSTIFGSAIAYGLFFYFASSGSLTSLSSLTFLTPVFALLFGNLLLSEVLSPLHWIEAV